MKLILKFINHILYFLNTILKLLRPFAFKNLHIDFNLIVNFIYSDLLYQLYLKNKFAFKVSEHKELLNKINTKNDWFTNNIPYLEFFLKKKKINNEKIKMLEIGSYTGNSTLFFLNNLKIQNITCVDTFEGSEEHSDKDLTNIYDQFIQNIIEFKHKVKIEKSSSNIFFEKNKNVYFNLIYIDGSHKYEDVLSDALNSFKILKKDGYLIFDDFLWSFYSDKRKNPLSAIKKFLTIKNGSYKIILTYYQIIIKKIN